MSKRQQAKQDNKSYAIRFSVSDEKTKKFIEEQAEKTGMSLSFVAQQLLVTAVNNNRSALAKAISSPEVKQRAISLRPKPFFYQEIHWRPTEIAVIRNLIVLFGENSLTASYKLIWHFLRMNYGYTNSPITLNLILVKLSRHKYLLRNTYKDEKVLTLHHKIHDLVNQAEKAGL